MPEFIPHQATPFEMFMAMVAGQKFRYEEDGYILEGYVYEGRLFVTAFIEPT